MFFFFFPDLPQFKATLLLRCPQYRSSTHLMTMRTWLAKEVHKTKLWTNWQLGWTNRWVQFSKASTPALEAPDADVRRFAHHFWAQGIMAIQNIDRHRAMRAFVQLARHCFDNLMLQGSINGLTMAYMGDLENNVSVTVCTKWLTRIMSSHVETAKPLDSICFWGHVWPDALTPQNAHIAWPQTCFSIQHRGTAALMGYNLNMVCPLAPARPFKCVKILR